MASLEPPPFLPAWSPARRQAPWRNDPDIHQKREPRPEPYGATSREYDKLAKAQELKESYQAGVARKQLELVAFGKKIHHKHEHEHVLELLASGKKIEHEEKQAPVSPEVQHLRYRVAIRRAVLALDGTALRKAFKEADPLVMHNLTRDSPGIAQLEDTTQFIAMIKTRLDKEKELVEALGVSIEDGRKMRDGQTLNKTRLRELAAALGHT